ncbi:MAG: GDSL-type esterase/lipase family protein, partial [Roseimicrobium sp.]
MHRLLLTLSVLFAIALPARSQTAPKPFADGDTVCFLGDSITHGGNWHRYIELFYVSRFPERKVNIVNCGIGGDRADGALKRLDWDVLVHQPTVIVIMLGMNDIGHANYDGPNPTPQMLTAREQSITAYRTNMTALIEA